MDANQDHDLLAFARATAADDTWSDAVRGQALLLVAKAGGKEDLDTLYGYLDSPSPLHADESDAGDRRAGVEGVGRRPQRVTRK